MGVRLVAGFWLLAAGCWFLVKYWSLSCHPEGIFFNIKHCARAKKDPFGMTFYKEILNAKIFHSVLLSSPLLQHCNPKAHDRTPRCKIEKSVG
jgi:hypothetical protein